MSRSAAEQVEAARKRGAYVFGETLAAAIGTDGTNYWHKCWKHAAGHIISPPLRPDPETPMALLNKLTKWVDDAGEFWDFETTLTSERASTWIFMIFVTQKSSPVAQHTSPKFEDLSQKYVQIANRIESIQTS